MGRKPPAKAELNPKQRRFLAEYLLEPNATQAAIRAGYSKRTAASQGHDLLRHPQILEGLERARKAAERRTDITVDRMLLELNRMVVVDPAEAFDDQGQPLSIQAIPEDVRRAITAFDLEDGKVVRIRFQAKTDATSQILRVLGAFKDRLELVEKPHAQLVEEALEEAKRRMNGGAPKAEGLDS